MEFVSRYVSHQPDINGYVHYSDTEHSVWRTLYQRQMAILNNIACKEFLSGLTLLGLDDKGIPQLPDINDRLYKLTGWKVAPVAALISAREFFMLLERRHFPAATFIRIPEELDYIQEPDVFHEIFGHCPMLTDGVFADFVHDYAKKVLTFDESDWPLLQRLFWFTVEFGLIRTPEGLRAYGGGILSSVGESQYAIDSDIPLRVMFDAVAAFRMPYRIDQMQRVYFVIEDYQQLFDFVHQDITKLMARARALGEFPPFFPIEVGNPSIHIRAC